MNGEISETVSVLLGLVAGMAIAALVLLASVGFGFIAAIVVVVAFPVGLVGLAVYHALSTYADRRALAPVAEPTVATRPVGITLIETTHVPHKPFTLRVAEAHDVCPLGFTVGKTWTFDQTGQITPSICRPPVVAVQPLLASLNGHEMRAQCHCPVAAGAGLTFAIESAVRTA